ncbi:MAG: glycosyltransferase, partial [Bacteroidales bacterium]|nr:glycosyltransferase [Bacteroidales bacterium]
MAVKKQEAANPLQPVSVIICARNECENLRRNLPKVLGQQYQNFEVIVVNDASEDGTEQLLLELKAKHKNLRTTALTQEGKFTHGKKLALTVGIKAAVNEWLLLTDADCYPESDQWLKGMHQSFLREASVVLGYGGYETRRGLLNLFIRYETCQAAMQ